MSLQSILNLTCPTKSNTLKTQVAKSLGTVAEVIYADVDSKVGVVPTYRQVPKLSS